MKLNIGDVVTVETKEAIYTVEVEDASKGDIIMGKVKTIKTSGTSAREAGKVYEFSRNDIKSAD